MSIPDITQPSSEKQYGKLNQLLTAAEAVEYFIRHYKATPAIPECDGYREARWNWLREAIGQFNEALEAME